MFEVWGLRSGAGLWDLELLKGLGFAAQRLCLAFCFMFKRSGAWSLRACLNRVSQLPSLIIQLFA